jgi:hypothetical protein
VRRLRDGQVLSKQVQVKANESTRMEESSLTLVGLPDSVGKGPTANLFQGRHELLAGTGLAPFDAFQVGVKASVAYSYFFSRLFGWRISASYVANLPTFLRTQLERDFGVQPTTFRSIGAEAHTGVVVEPRLYTGANSELRFGASLGPGLVVLTSTGDVIGAQPTVAGALELTWMLFGIEGMALGLKLGASDALILPTNGGQLTHFGTFNLGAVWTLGAAR